MRQTHSFHRNPNRLSRRLSGSLSLGVISAAVLATTMFAGMPQDVQAATRTSTPTAARITPRISGFQMEQVQQVQAGSELEFTMWGTPRSTAQVRIDGALRTLTLSEVADGLYQGTYVVSTRDRITPSARTTGTLRNGNIVTTATLDHALQVGAPAPAAAASVQTSTSGTGNGTAAMAAPMISRVAVQNAMPNAAPGSLQRNLIRYTVFGTPGGKASVSVPNLQPTAILLDEVRPGEYSAVHQLSATQTVDTNAPITARITANNQTTTQTIERAWTDVSLNQVAVACVDCGKIVAINQVQVDGDNPGVLGTLGGGALGGLLGTQVGQGRGKQVATVVGAVGGAIAGREIERRRNLTTRYEVVVAMDGGRQQTVVMNSAPVYRVGDSVRVVDGELQAR